MTATDPYDIIDGLTAEDYTALFKSKGVSMAYVNNCLHSLVDNEDVKKAATYLYKVRKLGVMSKEVQLLQEEISNQQFKRA